MTPHPDDWVTVMVTPATAMVPVRGGPSVGGTRTLTTPGPLPLLPLAIVIQPVWLSATHGHAAAVCTGTSAEPPAELTLNDVTPVAYVQPIPCVTWTLWPAMVSVAAREGPVVGATSKTTFPSPGPFRPPTMVIHEAPSVADHVHWLVV